jgi:tetratricopeptide (TPR) repeat protein
VALYGHPIYIFSMIRVSVVLALLFVISPSRAITPQKSFEEVSKRADAARASDQITEAIGLYREAVKLRPGWIDGWWWLGSLLYEQDRFDEAVPSFKKFVSIAPKKAPGFAFLALCEFETHDFASSLQHFAEWGRRGSPGDDALLDVAGFHWALLLTRQGRFVESLYLLAAKARKLGRSPALIEAMGIASLHIANLPEDYPAERRELVWLAGQAAFYSAVDAFPRANAYADRLLVHYDHEPNVHYFRGTLFSFQKEFAAAEKEYRQELALSPQHVPSIIELAFVYIDDLRPDHAVPLAERAVAVDPNNPRARYALGRALLDTGRIQESATQLEVAKRLAPGSAQIHFSLAKTYKALGRNKEAQQETAAFVSLKDKQEILAPARSNTPPRQERQR